MSRNLNPFAGWAIKLAFTVMLAVAGLPSLAHAQSTTPFRGSWMATSATESMLSGRGFGRLTLVEGVLAYQSPGFEWHLELAEIVRIGTSRQVPNALEIESVTGQVYFVGILDGQLTMTSPGKAVRAIERAVRTAPSPAPAPSRATATAAGGSVR